MDADFLTLDEVFEIHSDQIHRYGGSLGVRDVGLLQSALAMPEASFDGEYLHPSIHEMAAAYLFHIVKNHPFLDGNKRTGTAAALVCFEMDGVAINSEADDLVDLVVGVAEGRIQKSGGAEFFRCHACTSASQLGE